MGSCDIVDDIEDILKANDGENLDEVDRSLMANKSYIVPKATTKRMQKLNENNNEEINADSIIPGTAKIYIKTWGCTHNTSDSEYMAGQLASYGYRLVDSPNDADLWLLNSCTVKNPAEDHFKNYIDKARENNKYLVLAGCVPQGAPKADYIQGLSVIGVQQIDRIIEVVEETLKGNSVRLFNKKKKDGKKYGGASLNLPKVRRNPLIEIISINTGCLNQCTYCKTKHARGELGSYSPDEIVERVRQSFEEGVCEIWLTSEDTGAYGRDIGVTIVELLWRIIENIPDNCMLRIGMTNPPYILEHLEEMAKILNDPHVYAFLHIPVQAGSDAVLADMKREYSCDDFCRIVDFLREKVPGINIATDVICGFPTETEADFDLTYKLIDKYKFSTLFINQFFPRPGTPAAKMRQVPTTERKKRTKIISDLFHSYTNYDKNIGKKYSVLVTEVSHDNDFYVAHNKCYEQILVPKLDTILGKMCEVEIIECGKWFMKGKLLNEDEVVKQSRPIVSAKKGEVTGVAVTNTTQDIEDDACGSGSCGDCSCNATDDHKSTKSTSKSNLFNDDSFYKYTYKALIFLSLAFATRMSWKFFINNKST